MDSPILVEAFRVWSGKGVSNRPDRSDSRLRLYVGDVAAEKLLPVIKRLELDFYETDAWRTKGDLSEMTNVASADFRLLHPEVANEITEILAWCYSYDFK